MAVFDFLFGFRNTKARFLSGGGSAIQVVFFCHLRPGYWTLALVLVLAAALLAALALSPVLASSWPWSWFWPQSWPWSWSHVLVLATHKKHISNVQNPYKILYKPLGQNIQNRVQTSIRNRRINLSNNTCKPHRKTTRKYMMRVICDSEFDLTFSSPIQFDFTLFLV